MDRKPRTPSRHRLEDLAWKLTLRDYRAHWEGERAVLVLGPRGTTLRPLSEFSDAELVRRVGGSRIP